MLTELSDLIRWLPELAADTELEEAKWNRVVELSEQMQLVVSPLVNLPADQVQEAASKAKTTLEGQITELHAIAATLPRYEKEDAEASDAENAPILEEEASQPGATQDLSFRP